VWFILRKGKWDLPEYYGSGEGFGIDCAYSITGSSYGPAYTLDQVYPFVRGSRIVIGFPDIVFGPSDAMRLAIRRLDETAADLVLGLFRSTDPGACDMATVSRSGEVTDLTIKPTETALELTWIFAVWSPTMTEFFHEYLKVPRVDAQSPGSGLPGELSVGHVLQAAIRKGFRTQSVTFANDFYLDIGTSNGLQRAMEGQFAGGNVAA
jgi:glucose-1-phosphate thymidylyltransferase